VDNVASVIDCYEALTIETLEAASAEDRRKTLALSKAREDGTKTHGLAGAHSHRVKSDNCFVGISASHLNSYSMNSGLSLPK
jgi:hypothetical protein